jgi:phospholipase/carboxylesterase
MCHGVRDGVLPAALGSASRDFLQSLGYTVEWKAYPMEHSVCMEEVLDLSRWLQARLARNL